MEIRETLDSYVNGNISYTKEKINLSSFSLGDFLEYYVENYNPDIDDIIRFVKRLC